MNKTKSTIDHDLKRWHIAYVNVFLWITLSVFSALDRYKCNPFFQLLSVSLRSQGKETGQCWENPLKWYTERDRGARNCVRNFSLNRSRGTLLEKCCSLLLTDPRDNTENRSLQGIPPESTLSMCQMQTALLLCCRQYYNVEYFWAVTPSVT